MMPIPYRGGSPPVPHITGLENDGHLSTGSLCTSRFQPLSTDKCNTGRYTRC
jgi:hypothetical protein